MKLWLYGLVVVPSAADAVRIVGAEDTDSWQAKAEPLVRVAWLYEF